MNDDLNRLIHTNAQIAFDVGVRTERQRIIRILQDNAPMIWREGIIDKIKEEQK